MTSFAQQTIMWTSSKRLSCIIKCMIQSKSVQSFMFKLPLLPRTTKFQQGSVKGTVMLEAVFSFQGMVIHSLIPNTPRPCFTLVCFTLFCFNTPCQFTLCICAPSFLAGSVLL
jgi:hypothetical protein